MAEPRKKLKRVLNLSEERTRRQLDAICHNYGATVHAKVRVADVVDLDALEILPAEYSFGLRAHFDFVVVDDDHRPLFAVEFDGPTHRSRKQRRRDASKNRLCRLAELPLIRINANHVVSRYRGMDLLSWFVHVWFLRQGFWDAQEAGIVPMDEIFDPAWTCPVGGRPGTFPLWLSLEPAADIREFAAAGRCVDDAPGQWLGDDTRGNTIGVAWLLVDDERALVAKSAIRAQLFPIFEDQLLEEILYFEIRDELRSFVEGRSQPCELPEITRTIRKFVEATGQFGSIRTGSMWVPWARCGYNPERGWYYDWT